MAKKEGLESVLNKYSAEREESLIPTGLYSIDSVLGGGLCPGGMYALWGPPGSFKSTIALQIAKSYCKRGEKVVFVDVEKALNLNQQEAFGVRKYVEDGTLIHVTVDTYVQVDELCMAVASDSSDIKLVIVDSETQLLPKIGEDAVVDSNQPGLKAKQGSVWLNKMKSSFYYKGITSIILCHARANLNMQSMYGPTTKMAGGYATLHIPDCIVQFQPGQKFGDKLAPSGVEVHISTDKNKFAAPFKRVDVKCWYSKGIKKSVELIDRAIAEGIIKQSGSFFTFGDKTVRGTEALYSMPTDDLKYLKSLLS